MAIRTILGSVASILWRDGLRPSANNERLLGSLHAQSAALAASQLVPLDYQFEYSDAENEAGENERRAPAVVEGHPPVYVRNERGILQACTSPR